MKIAVIAPGRPTWVEKDIEILKRFADVEFIDSMAGGFWLRKILSADVCYFWFGSLRHLLHVLVAKVARKKIVIVAGGYDVNLDASIGYGLASDRGPRRFLRRLIFRCADEILAVSEFTRDSAVANLQVPREHVKVLPLAFEVPPESLKPWQERKRQVALVMTVRDDMFMVKGGDRIPEICAALPDVQFKLLGGMGEIARRHFAKHPSPNLEYMGFLPFQGEEFNRILNESRVICLPSRVESFGAALIDGALQGCVPVAFSVGALPEVIGGIGECVPAGDVAALVRKIADVLNRPAVDVNQLRAHAERKFSLKQRQQQLSQLI